MSESSSFGVDSGYSDLGNDSSLTSSSTEASVTQNAEEVSELNSSSDLVAVPSEVVSDSEPENFSNALAVFKKKPTLKEFVVSCVINCFLPFVNGMMLGFGEIFAHELGFRWGWSAARVCR